MAAKLGVVARVLSEAATQRTRSKRRMSSNKALEKDAPWQIAVNLAHWTKSYLVQFLGDGISGPGNTLF